MADNSQDCAVIPYKIKAKCTVVNLFSNTATYRQDSLNIKAFHYKYNCLEKDRHNRLISLNFDTHTGSFSLSL